MFNSLVDITKFIGEKITADQLEFLLNEESPIVELDEKSFFKLEVNEEYKKNQHLKKALAEKQITKEQFNEIMRIRYNAKCKEKGKK